VNPIFTLIKHYLGFWGLVAFSLSVIFSVFGCYLATLNATARMLFGMARDGLLPKHLSKIHGKYLTPVTAIYASTMVAGGVLIPSYIASWVLGASNWVQLTYGAMEYTYAVDSLYYVLSLAIIAAAASRVVSNYGKAVTIGGAALMLVTFYESAQYMPIDYIVIASVALIIIIEAVALRTKLRNLRVTMNA